MSLWKELLDSDKPLIGMSPMDGITDEAFRLTQIYFARPDFNFTEFVSAEGISRGGVKLYDQLLFSSSESPIIGQLFGKDPDSFYKSSIILCELGFDGVDINMGCPAKTVVHNGSGAALIGKPELASEIIKAAKSGISDWSQGIRKITDIGLNQKTLDVIAKNKKYTNKNISLVNIPTFSVKTRLGINEIIIEKWSEFLLSHELDFLTIHGRTLKQAYSGVADWNAISAAAKNNNTKAKIFGNGDISSRQQGIEYSKKYGVNGVLIGRAICGNPWVFSDYQPSPQDRFSAMLYHSQIFKEVFPHRVFDSLRKHYLFYTSGLPNAKSLRTKLIKINSVEQLLELEKEFIN